MDLVELERKLIAAARANPPSDGVPYAFEKRIGSQLQAKSVLNPEAFWAFALWRSAAVCLGIVLIVGAASHFVLQTSRSTTDLSQDFEKTMLAAVNQEPDYSW